MIRPNDITVAIPTIPPRGALLQRAISSVLSQTLPAGGLSVAVDNQRSGAAGTRARALAAVTSPWVAFLDDDAVAERTWLTNPLTGRWEELTPGTGFNPAVLFDPDAGWVALLADLTDVSFVATEEDGHHLTATVPPARVEVLTAGFAAAQSVPIDLWLDESSGRIRRLELSTTGDAGVSDWRITLSDYDEPVEIEPPAVE